MRFFPPLNGCMKTSHSSSLVKSPPKKEFQALNFHSTGFIFQIKRFIYYFPLLLKKLHSTRFGSTYTKTEKVTHTSKLNK